MAEPPAQVIDNIIKNYFAAALEEMRDKVHMATSWSLPGIEAEREVLQTATYLKELKSELVFGNCS